MWQPIKELDRILRGEVTRLPALREGTIRIPVAGLTLLIVVLGVAYGFCMGWFALFGRSTPEYRQLLATMLKVPALFFLALVVTFPSLYVFNALVGSRLTLNSLLKLLIVSLGVTLAVLASMGPIVAFFSLTTENYPFMVLLNVSIFAVSGVLGLIFLLQTLHRLTVADTESGKSFEEGARRSPGPIPGPNPIEQPPGGALDQLEGHVLGRHEKTVFRVWVIVFALVGGQMGWVLRPFIGNPGEPFDWFRRRESHFFKAVWQTFWNLFN